MTTAVYAGSFDPLTLGHTWIIDTVARLFQSLTVVISNNPQKKYMLDYKVRFRLVSEYIHKYKDSPFHVYAEDLDPEEFLLRAKRPDVLVRGIRNTTDFDYEKSMATYNRLISDKIVKAADNIETIYLIPPPEICYISSSAVKDIINRYRNWDILLEDLVPENVRNYLLHIK